MFFFICANKEAIFFWVCFKKIMCKPFQQSTGSLFKVLEYSLKMFTGDLRSIIISIFRSKNPFLQNSSGRLFWIFFIQLTVFYYSVN